MTLSAEAKEFALWAGIVCVVFFITIVATLGIRDLSDRVSTATQVTAAEPLTAWGFHATESYIRDDGAQCSTLVSRENPSGLILTICVQHKK